MRDFALLEYDNNRGHIYNCYYEFHNGICAIVGRDIFERTNRTISSLHTFREYDNYQQSCMDLFMTGGKYHIVNRMSAHSVRLYQIFISSVKW